MNARPIIIALVMAAASHASELHWRNGESVSGDFVGIEDGHVIWSTPIFSEDIHIGTDVLRRIDHLLSDSATQEPFSIRLADGSRLYGSITGLDARTLGLKSARFGSIQVLREAVVAVQRLKVDGFPLPALAGTSGWIESSSANNAPVAEKLWRMVPGAALRQVGWNRRASLPLQPPEKLEMQFTLSSTVRPEFRIELKASEDERMIVETWIDDVVLQGRVFENVQKLADDTRRITLSMFWDRTSGLCAIYGANGQKLAQTNMPPVVGAEPAPAADAEEQKPARPAGGGGLFGALIGMVQGVVRAQAEAQEKKNADDDNSDASPVGFTLVNKGPDLTLQALRIRAWDGRLPADITSERPRVELTDGRYLRARAVRADAATLTIRLHDGHETTLPWDKVLAVEMVPESSPFFQAAPPCAEMWFTDGEWISGTLLHVRNGTASFRTTFSAAPVSFKTSALHHLDFKDAEDTGNKTGLAALDTLSINRNVLHGTLETGGDAQPRWRPVGALGSTALTGAGEMEITRAVADPAAGMRSEALFYLQDGDVLPGRLRAIDSRQVDLESDVASLRHLPAGKLQAIQFGGTTLNLDGFEDPGWRRVRGSAQQVKRTGTSSLDLEPGGSWGHPAFMQVNEIRFTLVNNGYSSLRVCLFCDGLTPSSPGASLLFGHMGSEVCFGLETSAGQMDRQFRLHTSGSVPVRISIAENTIEVFFNGVSARRITLSPKMRSGSGIILEPFSLWGNGERTVKISGFGARIVPGRVVVPLVDARAREHALTIPRFRREDPPRHALLAANGDLLRGVIEAATADHFAIRSGLETVRVPLARVKAAIWLVQPADAVSAAFEALDHPDAPPLITHWLLLNNGGRLGLQVSRFADNAVFGASPLLGDCRVPLSLLYMIRSTHPQDNAAMLALRDWRLKFAPEPVLPESGGESSPLLHQEAKPFKLPLLSGGDFDLAHEKGRVVVLDFWATWCGPCVKSLPQMIDAMSAFDSGGVRFIGVNQAEDAGTVKSFLEARGWNLEVALDAGQRVGQSFGVEGIPHTVVVGPDGRVAWVKTGYDPEGARQLSEAVKKLLKK